MHFFGPHCKQMETDIKNPPHGFSPERIHLVFHWRFPHKVMDYDIFSRFFEHGFCSCGQQRNRFFQKFASTKLNSDSISSYVFLFKQTRIWLQRAGGSTGLKDFSFSIWRANQELRWTEQETLVFVFWNVLDIAGSAQQNFKGFFFSDFVRHCQEKAREKNVEVGWILHYRRKVLHTLQSGTIAQGDVQRLWTCIFLFYHQLSNDFVSWKGSDLENLIEVSHASVLFILKTRFGAFVSQMILGLKLHICCKAYMVILYLI